MEPLDDQSDAEARILDDRHGVLVGGILEVGVVHGQNPVAHLQHIALVGRTGRDDVLDEHASDRCVAADVHLGGIEGGGGLRILYM